MWKSSILHHSDKRSTNLTETLTLSYCCCLSEPSSVLHVAFSWWHLYETSLWKLPSFSYKDFINLPLTSLRQTTYLAIWCTEFMGRCFFLLSPLFQRTWLPNRDTNTHFHKIHIISSGRRNNSLGWESGSTSGSTQRHMRPCTHTLTPMVSSEWSIMQARNKNIYIELIFILY